MTAIRHVLLGAVLALLCSPISVHANDVLVSVSGGKMTVKGDDDANVIQIDQAGMDVRVTPGGTTTVNGSALPQLFPAAAAGLKVALAGGADELTLTMLTITGKVTIAMGAGADTLTITSVNLGPTKLDLGADDNTVTSVGLIVAGDLVVKGGKGSDSLGFQQTLAGKMKFGLGDGTDSLALCEAHVSDGIAVDLGPGVTGTSMKSCGGTFPATAAAAEGNSLAASGIVIDAGGLSVKGGTGNDGFASSLMSIQGDVKISLGNGRGGFSMCEVGITGSVKAKLGKPGPGDTTSWCRKANAYDVTVTAQTLFVIAEVNVGGDFIVKSSTGNDAGAALMCGFGGVVKLDFGNGLNVANLQTDLFTEDLIIKTGKQDDDIRVAGSQVGRSSTITLGDGTNKLEVSGTAIGGDLSVKAGAGDDTIDVSTAIVSGTKSVDADGGMNAVTP
jgi:hypothetical protein